PHARAELRAMMERQLGAMTRLVNDLLDIDRIQRGEIALAREPVPVSTLVDRAIEASLPALTASRHELTVQRPDDALTIDADPGRIVQVVINLLTNAAKYTPPGGRIEVTAHRDGGDAVVAVADNGIGIPPESLGQVFEM